MEKGHLHTDISYMMDEVMHFLSQKDLIPLGLLLLVGTNLDQVISHQINK